MMSTSTTTTTPTYVLGHSEHELQRLILQSRFLGELTEEVFRRAGIGEGMRVLDVGCGAGDVSLLLASMVGPAGAVIGVDRSPDAVRTARERAAAAGLSRVTFLEGDLVDVTLEEPVDAVVGRLVLLYLAEPATALQQLCRFVRPGGIVAFQEMEMTTSRSVPSIPLFDLTMRAIVETFRRARVELDMGSRLFATFRAAGLPAPEMVLRARVESAADSPVYAYLTNTLRSLLPMAERLGVTTAAEVDIDTLAQRLCAEVVRSEAVVIPPSMIGAWTRTSGGIAAA
jgi:SAM-dependent methyltransferase